VALNFIELAASKSVGESGSLTIWSKPAGAGRLRIHFAFTDNVLIGVLENLKLL
jgi:hypothetical protein